MIGSECDQSQFYHCAQLMGNDHNFNLLNMKYQFEFPREREPYISVRGKAQVLSILQREDDYDYFRVKYRISLRKEKYLYCRCGDCTAVLTFRKSLNKEQYCLLKFNNLHSHLVDKFQTNSMLVNFIKDIPDSIELKYAKLLTLNSIPGISEAKFYYFYQKIKNYGGSLSQLIKKLDGEGYDMISVPFDRYFASLPDLLLLVSPLMKKNFQKYGSFTCFDLTFHTIKDRKEGKIFKVGAFLGLSAARKIVPFAFAILLDQSKERFYELFKNFGQIMQNHPTYYITDQSAGMIAALKELKSEEGFNSFHIFDIFHLQRNIRKRLIVKENLKYFTSIMRSKNEFQFENNLADAYDLLESQQQIELLTNFIHTKANSCFAYIPLGDVIGFTPSTSINQKFHDLLKRRIPYQKPYIKVIFIALKVLQEMGNKCQNFKIERFPLEKYYFSDVKEIRFSVDKRVFQEFCGELHKIYYLQVVNRQNNLLQLTDIHLGCTFKLVLEETKWKCSCKYNERSGLPCSHILKACLMSKQRIIAYIHPRWIVVKPIGQPHKRVSSGRISRRNKR